MMEFERYLDDKAGRAMRTARRMAGRMGRQQIGTEYLLWGLVRQRRSELGKRLAAAGVTDRRLEQKLIEYYGQSRRRTSPCHPTPNLQLVIGQAKKAGGGQVSAERLLGGILSCHECTARLMMEQLQADIVALETSVGVKTAAEPKTRMAAGKASASVLDKYAVDLTEQARLGQLDPVIGRENEVFRMMTILTRRTKNNPVLLGDPGVGKTALAEALAQAIANGVVPVQLSGTRLMSLDMAGLISGTKYRGEFEERLRGIVRELKNNRQVILFIDEVHTLVGAGAAEGAIDAANLLKPALARGEIRLIGTTTVEEYHRTIEKDAALERRFQRIDIREPDEQTAERILAGLAPRYELHHGVHIEADALREAVRISVRVSPERFLPDKAIDLLDETCAAVRMQEKHVVQACDVVETVRKTMGFSEVYSGADAGQLLRLEEELSRNVVGQRRAISEICHAVRRGAAGLREVTRPQAALLLTGPTGVGKTSVCTELSRQLFGRDSLIRIDLNEYQQPHDVSRLIGAPPGYKGYGEGGQLTERIRRHPRSVVLFDEVEKAHPDVLQILLRILEDGRVSDAEGRIADFRHAVIVLTSNVGCAHSMSRRVGFGDSQSERERTNEEVRRVLSTELAARLDGIIPFAPLTKTDCEQIAELELRSLSGQCELRSVSLVWGKDAAKVLGICDPNRGARAVRDEVARRVTDPLAMLLLRNEHAEMVEVTVVGGEVELKCLQAAVG